MEYAREEVLAQIRNANEQGDPVGPYKLGDEANLITDFLAQYNISIDSDGGVVDEMEEREDD